MLELLPEWHPQWGILLVWPKYISTLPAVEKNYANLVATILQEEPVLLICADEAHQAAIKEQLQRYQANMASLHWHFIANDSKETKDSAPLVTRHFHDLAMHVFDDKETVLSINWQLPVHVHNDLKLEAGAIGSDGRGNIIASKPHLLELNPHLDRQGIAQRIRGKFGTRTIWWLENSKLETEKTYNVGKFVRFCNPHTLSYSQSADPKGDYYATLSAVQKELYNIASGESIDLVPLPLPLAKYGADGKRLPASYTHFVILQNTVLVPGYGCIRDESAVAQLAHAMPHYHVKTVDCSALLEHGIELNNIAIPLPEGVL